MHILRFNNVLLGLYANRCSSIQMPYPADEESVSYSGNTTKVILIYQKGLHACSKANSQNKIRYTG